MDVNFFLLPVSPVACILTAVALAAAIYVLAVTLPRLKRILNASRQHDATADGVNLPPVTVIVCSHAGSRHLRQLLADILGQDYDAPFEVVVVNDEGHSNTDDIVRSLQVDHRNLFITFLPDDTRSLSRRKLAVTLGVKAAHYECLLLTTSNCTIPSRLWLRSMARHFADKSVEVVLGYGRHCGNDDTPDHGRGSGRRTFDRMRSALLWVGSALGGRPLRGTASNLAYRRSVFFEHKGFSSALHLNYGDDDLFVSEISSSDNCVAEISPDAIVNQHESDVAYSHRAESLRREFTSAMLPRAPFRLMGSVAVALWIWLGSSVSAVILGVPSLLPVAAALIICAGLWIPVSIMWRKVCAALEGGRQGWSALVWWLMQPMRTVGRRWTAWRRRRSNFTWG